MVDSAPRPKRDHDELERIERRLVQLHDLCRDALLHRWATQAQAAEFFAAVANEVAVLLESKRHLRG